MSNEYLLLVAIYHNGADGLLPLPPAHAHTCAHASYLRVCFPTDEKEESILGSIPLLSFRVAAVQPSDNISRKHTFKVSWLSSPGSDGGGRPVLLEHRGIERGQEPPPKGVSSGSGGRELSAAPGLSAGCCKAKVRPCWDPLFFPQGLGG